MIKILKNIILFLFVSNTYVNAQDEIPKHQTIEIFSKTLNENRIITIWTPDDYTTSNQNYPVLYMLDGGINEDFPHLANTIAELVNSKQIIPIILVGIENTERRRDLTGYTTIEKDKKIAPIVGESTNFRTFIADELIPKINQKYRVNDQKGIIGESLAGLFVVETLFEQPELFDDYIAFDPSLWWNNQYIVKNSKSNLSITSSKPLKFWFAGSGAKDINANTKQLAKNLKNNPLANLKWIYADEPKEKHNTIFRATKEKALIWTFSK